MKEMLRDYRLRKLYLGRRKCLISVCSSRLFVMLHDAKCQVITVFKSYFEVNLHVPYNLGEETEY